MSEDTRILSTIEQGDLHAAEPLLLLLYSEFEKLTAEKLGQEKPDQTLQATAPMHEAYLRLMDADKAPHRSNRRRFVAAAEAVGRTLTKSARPQGRRKYDGTYQAEVHPVSK